MSDDLFETRNKYKIININSQPKYLIVQLSQNYCTLMDYDQLDFVKNNNLFVHYGGSVNAKKYSHYGSTHQQSVHRYLLNLDKDNPELVDHMNRYPLDNRMVNLIAVSHSENNKNKSCINGIDYDNLEDGTIKASIFYRTNPSKPQITQSEIFANIQLAQSWIKQTYAQIENQFSPLDPTYKVLAIEYEQIMNTYADGFKWSDHIIQNQADKQSAEISVLSEKKQIYAKFVEMFPDFVIKDEVFKHLILKFII